MDELLKMWKEDKLNGINKRLEEIEVQKISTQSMIDHYIIQLNQAEKEKTELEAVLKRLEFL